MNTLFCPKCYRNLEVSDWESDEEKTYYRCKKECCEIEFRKSDNFCLVYQFTLPKLPYTVLGCSKFSDWEENVTMLVAGGFSTKKIVETKEFIPVKFDSTLPAQIERIYKRLMKLRAFS